MSLSLWHFYNLPLAVWGENLGPVPKGKYCVYWPPSPPEQLSEPSTSQNKERKEGKRKERKKNKGGREKGREEGKRKEKERKKNQATESHNSHICANGSLENTAPNHLTMCMASSPKPSVLGNIKHISTDLKGPNDTKHIL